MFRLLGILIALAVLGFGTPAFAQSNVGVNCSTGTTSAGAVIWAPASPTNPCPVTVFNTPSGPTYIATVPQVYADTVKSLTAATDTTLLAASTAGRNKSVCLMNIGLNPVTITNGASAAVVGNGQALSPAAGAGFQGGGYCYPGPPTNAIHGISTLGTTVIVTVGQ